LQEFALRVFLTLENTPSWRENLAAAGRRQARREPGHVAALRARYSALFDAGEFRQAASVYGELLAAEAQGCRCGHVYRHHDTEHGGCSVCACSWFVASQLLEEDP
jgi:hypothetical protein